MIEKLAEKKRTVFVLHEVEGLSPAEISTIVGAPVLTVRTRLFYARKELASMLRDEPLLAAFAEGFCVVECKREPIGSMPRRWRKSSRRFDELRPSR